MKEKMKEAISKIQAISNRLDQLDKDSTNWQIPDNVLIVDRYADAYAVGFREATKQIRLTLEE